MQEREEEGTAKTPILGDIPLLGWLFKFKNITRNKTNLLVFLSPHIVKESTKLAQITENKHEEFKREGKFYNRGELLVKFREGVSKDRALEIISGEKGTVVKYFESIGVYHITLKLYDEVEEAVEKFNSYPEVLYAEPNYKVVIQATPREKTDDKKDYEAPFITPADRALK